jgi:hypothetical protein
MSRYQGKPLLRLLELYVLWCVGELPERDQATLQEMEPKLRSTYQKTGTWYEILEAVMDLPIQARQEIRIRWQTRQGSESPQRFAEAFVDENLT